VERIDQLYLASLAPAGVALGVMLTVGVAHTPLWLSALGALGALTAGYCDRQGGHLAPREAFDVKTRRPDSLRTGRRS
jgi:hypothetical protein